MAPLSEGFHWVLVDCQQEVQRREVVDPSNLVEDHLSNLVAALAFLKEEARRLVSVAGFCLYLRVDHQAFQL